ncbi:MAG: hypothetical protein ACKOZZ_06820, partial [Bacteroidota bacterium]
GNYPFEIVFSMLLLIFSSFNGKAEGEFVLTNDQLQRLLGPTLTSTTAELSATSGSIQIRLPNGQFISRPISVPPFEVSGINCTLRPIRNSGTPTLVYRDGYFRFSIMLRPVVGRTVLVTNGWWPNITASGIQVDISFRLKLENGIPVVDAMTTSVTGDIDLTGIFSPLSPVMRPRIQQEMASRIEREIKPQLNLVLAIVLPAHIAQATGYGSSLLFSGAILHERDRILFTITGRNQAAPRPTIVLTGIDPSQVNPDILQLAATWPIPVRTSAKADASSFAPAQLKENVGAPLGSVVQNNDWSFNVVKMDYSDKTGLGFAVSVQIVNVSKLKRSLSETGFINSPTFLDANGNPAPMVDAQQAGMNFFGYTFAPGETAIRVLYFNYQYGVNPKNVAPDLLTLVNKMAGFSVNLRLK